MLTALNVTSRQAYLWVGLTLIGPDLTNTLGASGSCGDWKDPGSLERVFVANPPAALELFDRNPQPCNEVSGLARVICLEN